ncbi:MAG TPA: hypothetical protein VI479_03345, partial [Blastocatellia bacterium]
FEAELPTETAGLKSALQKEREAKTALEKSLKGFEGIDPEEAKRLKAEAEKIEADKLKSKGDWDAREKQLKEQLAADLQKRETHFQTELKSRDDRIVKLQTSMEKSLIEAQSTTAIAAAKGSPELLLPHVMRQVKIVEENGDFVVRVLDAQGQPRIANVKGDPFTIANLIDEMKGNQIYGRAFDASGAGGSGAGKSDSDKSGVKTVRWNDQDALNSNIEAIAKGEVTVVT